MALPGLLTPLPLPFPKRKFMRPNTRLGAALVLMIAAGCSAAVGAAGDAPTDVAPVGTTVFADTGRAAAWRQDLEVLLARVRRIHPRPFAYLSEAEVEAERNRIAAAIPTLEDEEVVLRLMELMARMTGGHTQLYGTTARTIQTRWFPVRFFEFEDAVGITAISATYPGLAGARVVRIGARDARAALHDIMRITPADNRAGRRHRAPYFMMMDWVMHGVGITPERGVLPLVVEGPGDRPRREITVTAVEADADDDLSYRWTESVAGGPVVLGRPAGEGGGLSICAASRTGSGRTTCPGHAPSTCRSDSWGTARTKPWRNSQSVSSPSQIPLRWNAWSWTCASREAATRTWRAP